MTKTNNLLNPNQVSAAAPRNSLPIHHRLILAKKDKRPQKIAPHSPTKRPVVANFQRSPCNSYSEKTVGKTP